MTAVFSPADASAKVGSVPGGRATKTKGQVVHLAPGGFPAMLDVQAVAHLLGCSQRHVYRLSDAGKMPAPVKLGSLVRWSTSSMREWIDGGCKPVRIVKGGAR